MPSKLTGTVLGHVGRNPEFKDVARGLTTFSVAVSHGKKVNGEWENSTTWVNIKIWGEWGKKLMDKVFKGDLVQVTGNLEMESWTGTDGTERSNLTMMADARDVLALTKHEDKAPAASVPSDDLPF